MTPPPTHGRCRSRCPARSSGTAAWSSRSTSRAAERRRPAPPAGWKRGREGGGAPGAAQGWDGQEAELWTRTPAFTCFFFLTLHPRNKQTNKLTNEPKKNENQKLEQRFEAVCRMYSRSQLVSHVSQRCLNPPVSPSRHSGNLVFFRIVPPSVTSPAKTLGSSAPHDVFLRLSFSFRRPSSSFLVC